MRASDLDKLCFTGLTGGQMPDQDTAGGGKLGRRLEIIANKLAQHGPLINRDTAHAATQYSPRHPPGACASRDPWAAGQDQCPVA